MARLRMKSGTNKKVLRPGLKRSKTGAIVRDQRAGRVTKRRKLFRNRTGPYARRR